MGSISVFALALIVLGAAFGHHRYDHALAWGGHVYDKLKETNPEVKVLLSSGYAIEGLASDILRRGCERFIQKPFTIEALSQKVREIPAG